MISKKQEVLKNDGMKELKRCRGIINDKTLLVTKLEFGNVESIPNDAMLQ